MFFYRFSHGDPEQAKSVARTSVLLSLQWFLQAFWIAVLCVGCTSFRVALVMDCCVDLASE
jgi:hypothetical protein